MGEKINMTEHIPSLYKYDVFISYTRNPDYKLARYLKNFLETFHETKTFKNKNLQLQQITTCIDGINFQARRKEKYNPSEENYKIIAENLQQSRELLVLYSTNSRDSHWVNYEVTWFLENKGLDKIRLGLTEGTDPLKPDEVFSQIIIVHCQFCFCGFGFPKP